MAMRQGPSPPPRSLLNTSIASFVQIPKKVPSVHRAAPEHFPVTLPDAHPPMAELLERARHLRALLCLVCLVRAVTFERDLAEALPGSLMLSALRRLNSSVSLSLDEANAPLVSVLSRLIVRERHGARYPGTNKRTAIRSWSCEPAEGSNQSAVCKAAQERPDFRVRHWK